MRQLIYWSAAGGLLTALLVGSQSAGQELAAGEAPRYFFDPYVEPAERLQPPAESITGEAPRQPTRRTRSQQANIRLASVPNMFGDLAMLTGIATVRIPNQVGNNTIVASQFGIPTVGSLRSGKISENDTPIPVDRVFFNYNHFHNLFAVNEQQLFPPGQPPIARQESLDRYTVGAEKTFLDGLFSIELRMPFFGAPDVEQQTFGIQNGNYGNLTAVLKALLYSDDSLAVGAGVAVCTPTGSDTVARIGLASLRFENEAVHLLPYLGFIYSPGDPTWGWGDGLFLTGYVQFDAAANSNPVEVRVLDGPLVGTAGKFTEQNLLFFDIGVGYWLLRNPYAPRVTGLAAVAEFHYTTAVQDADVLATSVGPGVGAVTLTNPFNRFDVVNFTAGVQALLFDASSLRVAFATPLGSGEDQRLFDAEVIVQYNLRF